MLYANRERDQRRREAEAAGDDVWTANFSPNVRVKIWLAFIDAGINNGHRAEAISLAHPRLLREEGVHDLAGQRGPDADLHQHLMQTDTAGVASVVEVLWCGLKLALPVCSPKAGGPYYFVANINEILAFERISFELIDGVMVPFESRELHVDVVLPSLTLLGGRPEFQRAESAYHDALQEIAHGDAADSITDAGRALQEVLVALGCKGNALGPLLKDAKTQRLFGAHDYPLLDALAKIVDWVSADRSVMGDAHNAGARTRDDAWLTVHVVGSLIVRLAGPPRV